MAEVLTESFCERCGTRYTFESSRPRVKRLKGVKVLSRGLKNFVLSDDSSLDEAMAAARSDTDREITAQQLDAFHQTFNFCMTCRQYTCANCWNEAEGTCLTCSPHLGREILPAPFPDLDPAAGIALVHAADGSNGHDSGALNGNGTAAGSLDLGAWPVSDLAAPEDDPLIADTADALEPVDAAARLAALTALEPDAALDPGVEAEVEPVAAEAPALEVAAEAPALEVIAEAPTEAETNAPAGATEHIAAAAAAQTAAMLHRFRPGQNLDAEIEAYEREQAALASDVPAAAEPATSEPGAVDGPEPLVAAAAITAGPGAEPSEADDLAQADADLDASAAAAALAAVRRTDIVEQPTWQIVAPDVDAPPAVMPPLTPPASPTPAGVGAPPAWPAKPEWPSQAQATAGLPFLGRPAQPSGGLDSLWAESNREVASAPAAPGRAAPGGVQPCVSCGLSLSATARFCRRCGTSQVA